MSAIFAVVVVAHGSGGGGGALVIPFLSNFPIQLFNGISTLIFSRHPNLPDPECC